ncbi:AAA family ATPase (plasmid) [Deinococcus taeanensis]|uniref:AAA family ATPase n=1 Tax=Deinococcus taeanensis TaxID=2737050 RepID=UPI001CDD0482|nr:AAA family ATPase [Deinococcus taeanensis]UBV45434.1 AAA family ATPase [Deinococcus taeanensis]
MMAPLRLHILGASGSGTSTLGQLLAARFPLTPYDTDDFFWEPTDPPYEIKRAPAERLAMLQQALSQHERWVLSGSLCGWGDPLIPLFDAVIFITLPVHVRLERTQQRERARFGDHLDEGGALHQKHQDFMAWSASYDDPVPVVGRNRLKHEGWLAQLPCPVYQVDNSGTLQDLLDTVCARLRLNEGIDDDDQNHPGALRG